MLATRLSCLAQTSIPLGIALASVALTPTVAAACPDAPKLIEHMTQAHGGLGAWASAPTVSFESAFTAAGAPGGVASRVTVEQGPRRAYLGFVGTETSMAWDGSAAWSENWGLPFPPRFFALLDYHFLNLPWLANDPGVVLSEFGTAQLPGDPTEYFSAKITYEAGVGDTPRDYYRIYVDPETHLLKACQYIVTYQALLPEGVTETPPNTLVYGGYAEVAGLKVPTSYTIYRPDGEVYGSAEIRDWSFMRPFDEARMTMPENAVMDESKP